MTKVAQLFSGSSLIKLRWTLSFAVLYGFLCLASLPLLADENLQSARNHFEAGFEFLKMETVGYRLSGAYLLDAGMPYSKIGLDLGQRLFEDSDERKTIKATEYGIFLQSIIGSQPTHAFYAKTAFQMMIFPSRYSSKSSMSSIEIEIGTHRNYGQGYWEFGLGARYRDQDTGKIVVGNNVIEQQRLFYPKIAFGLSF